MGKKKSVIISISIVLLLIFLVFGVTYAYLVLRTDEGDVEADSSMLGITYVAPDDLSGNLSPSFDRSGGIVRTATARINANSEITQLNLYLTPTALTNLNISALKWEAEGVRSNEVVCSGAGDFSTASVDNKIKIIDSCAIDTTDTVFNIYVWLDLEMINSNLDGATFGAKISADSVPITGEF